jgi:hypothetical protein
MSRDDFGFWNLTLPLDKVPHDSKIKLHIQGADLEWKDKISPWIKYAV